MGKTIRNLLFAEKLLKTAFFPLLTNCVSPFGYKMLWFFGLKIGEPTKVKVCVQFYAVELTRVNTPSLAKFQSLASHEVIQNVVTAAGKKRFTDENIAMQIYHMATSENPDFSTKSFREWAKSVEVNDAIMDNIKIALDSYAEFFKTLCAVNDKKIIRSVKARTHFVSSVFYCYMAKLNGKTQEDINGTLREFFSGSPSISDDYNKTVGSGSAKPGAVQTRQRIMRELACADKGEVLPF